MSLFYKYINKLIIKNIIYIILIMFSLSQKIIKVILILKNTNQIIVYIIYYICIPYMDTMMKAFMLYQ